MKVQLVVALCMFAMLQIASGRRPAERSLKHQIDTTAGSCEFLCGLHYEVDGVVCYCDNRCKDMGDCCDDIDDACPGRFTTSVPFESCDGNCGSGNTGCFCDESCKVNENCCEDFEDACPLHAYFADFHVNNQKN